MIVVATATAIVSDQGLCPSPGLKPRAEQGGEELEPKEG